MQNKSRGMTLVSVLVAVALLGILAATLATIFGNMSGLYLRSNQSSEAQNMTRLVQNIVAQKNLCTYALRATPYAVKAPGTPYTSDWSWDFRGNPTPAFHVVLDHIEINPGGTYGNQALAVQATDTISPNLQIKGIYLRLPDPANGEGKANFSTAKIDVVGKSKTYNTTSAKLVISYGIPGPIVGTSLRDGVVDVTIATDPTNGNAFAFCYQGQPIQAVNVVCAAANSLNACPATADPCVAMYYVSGFDTDGNPNCRCQVVCQPGGYKVVTGTGSPAPPAPGPGPAPGGKPSSFNRGLSSSSGGGGTVGGN